MEKPIRALVLAGGGAKGSYQVGAYRALQELGWQPDIITGASVGSLNGVLFTMGKLEEAAAIWRSMDLRGVIELPEKAAPEELRGFFLDVVRGGGLDVEPLAETIDRYIDEEAVRRSPIRFGLVMTEMEKMESVQCPIDEIPEGKLKEYMLASSACFPALRPREIDGVKYIDGGWRDNMPLELAAKMGATELLGVDISGVGITRPNRTGLPTQIIKSHWYLGPTLDFDPERAKRNMALGYLDAMRQFGRIGGTAYGILPDEDGFLPRFTERYQAVLDEVGGEAPELKLAVRLAFKLAHYPEEDALSALELAAERLEVDPAVTYTPRTLALNFLGSFHRDPAQRFESLFDGVEGSALGERAMAAAAPEEFVTAAVSRALMTMKLF